MGKRIIILDAEFADELAKSVETANRIHELAPRLPSDTPPDIKPITDALRTPASVAEIVKAAMDVWDNGIIVPMDEFQMQAVKDALRRDRARLYENAREDPDDPDNVDDVTYRGYAQRRIDAIDDVLDNIARIRGIPFNNGAYAYEED